MEASVLWVSPPQPVSAGRGVDRIRWLGVICILAGTVFMAL